MKLFCWNINALSATVPNIKYAHGSLKAFFEEELKADIVALQEIKLAEAKLTQEYVCVDGWQSFWACSQGKLGYSGVTTWARGDWAPLAAASDQLGGGGADIDREGRVVVTDHGPFVLFNVYVPNRNFTPEERDFKLRFLRALRRAMDEYAAAGRAVIAAGDFNVAAAQADSHWPLDEDYPSEERAELLGMIAAFPDAWRQLHPGALRHYSVWCEKKSGRERNQGARIDYVLVSPSLVPHVRSCDILYKHAWRKWSDHAPVVIEFDPAALQPPPHRPPCKAWLDRKRKFVDPAQRSIASMFKPLKKQKLAAAAGGAGDAAAASASAAEEAAAAGGQQGAADGKGGAAAAAAGGEGAAAGGTQDGGSEQQAAAAGGGAAGQAAAAGAAAASTAQAPAGKVGGTQQPAAEPS